MSGPAMGTAVPDTIDITKRKGMKKYLTGLLQNHLRRSSIPSLVSGALHAKMINNTITSTTQINSGRNSKKVIGIWPQTNGAYSL